MQEVLDKSVLDEDEDSIEVSDEEAVAGTPGARRRMSIAAKKGAAAKQQQQEEAAKAAAGPKPSPGGSKLVRMASTYGINTARLDDLDDDEAKVSVCKEEGHMAGAYGRPAKYRPFYF